MVLRRWGTLTCDGRVDVEAVVKAIYGAGSVSVLLLLLLLGLDWRYLLRKAVGLGARHQVGEIGVFAA